MPNLSAIVWNISGRKRRVLGIGLAALTTLLIIFGLVVGLWLPGFAKTKAQEALSQTLGRTVTIGEISISPYTLTATIRDLRIAQSTGDEPLLAIEAIVANISSSSLVYRAPVFQEILIKGPDLKLARNEKGRLSIADVIERFAQAEPEPEDVKPFYFAVHNLSLERGNIQFDDQAKGKRHVISELFIGIPVMSNLASQEEIWVEPKIQAKINGAEFALNGRADFFGQTKQTSLEIKINGLPLKGLETYAEVVQGLRINDGQLSTNLVLNFIQEPKKTPTVQLTGEAAISALDTNYQPRGSRWALTTQGINIIAQGIDLRMPSLVETSTLARLQIGGDKNSPEQGSIRIRDTMLSSIPPLVIEKPLLSLEKIALSGDSKAQLSLSASINQRGSLEIKGDIAGLDKPMEKLAAELAVDAKRIDIVAFQGLAAEHLGQALLTQGSVSATASVVLKGAQASINGDVTLNDFNALRRPVNTEVLSWKAIELRKLALNTEPFSMQAASMLVNGLTTRLVLLEDGRLNFVAMTEKDDGEKKLAAQEKPAADAKSNPKQAAAARQAIPVVIQSLTLRNSDVFFVDRFTKPNFQASLTGIGGTVGPLKAGAAGAINLKGMINKSAPMNISGTVDPFASELALDMRVSASGIDLPPLSPYSIRHLAYPIERGKLSLDLAYKVERRRLEARNQIFIDQLTFGPKAESPNALSIPVTLAVALLKNSKGEININLPVNGSIDDPQFSVAGIVFQALINLVVKAVTAPFALLGSLFAGGADLSHIDFAPGSAEIGTESAKALAGLVKALLDRPQLRLDITGGVNLSFEKNAMLRAKLLEQVKAEKAASLAKKGQSSGTLAEMRLEPDEYLRYLTDLYKRVPFEKPRNLVGMVKTQPLEEMEKLLFANMRLTEADSLALADRRSQAVRARLIQEGVPAGQVFVLGARLNDASPPGEPGRASFALK